MMYKCRLYDYAEDTKAHVATCLEVAMRMLKRKDVVKNMEKGNVWRYEEWSLIVISHLRKVFFSFQISDYEMKICRGFCKWWKPVTGRKQLRISREKSFKIKMCKFQMWLNDVFHLNFSHISYNSELRTWRISAITLGNYAVVFFLCSSGASSWKCASVMSSRPFNSLCSPFAYS